MAAAVIRLIATAGAALIVSFAQAVEIPPPAYQLIAQPYGIPSEVLYSLALNESAVPLRGQRVPWPWTLNVKGASLYYPTRGEACRALLAALSSVDPKRVDSGLGQVNMGWHGHRFDSPCDSLDPYKNLNVASQILLEQKARGGDWITAAGHYHHPAGGAPAAKYRLSFAKHLSRVTGTSLLASYP